MSVVRRMLPSPEPGETRFLTDLLRSEPVGGSLALAAAVVALVWANSGWSSAYHSFIGWDVGPLDLEHWGADGALTLFFFVAGLEVKREFVVGSLRRPADAAVPVAAALCGVAVPALLYTVVNLIAPTGQPAGWAIPAATDIAFALAVLAVVGSHLPPALRAFLLTLAVVDDLVVILIIAFVFTDGVHVADLLVSLALALLWALLQWRRLGPWPVYLVIAVAGWWFMHESGVHATIDGVLLGLLTRVRRDPGEERSPAEAMEHALAPISSTVAVPFFALVSAGVPISGGDSLLHDPVVIGVLVGLALGKPIGVLGGTYLATRLTRAELNEDLTWGQLAGVAVLAGIGFTVSLLVSDLSFSGHEADAAKAAVLAASVIAALLGALVLRRPRRLGES
ncbi:MAG TPA: Na+/H+ antiporter NhaA [Nocardioides sp.]|nr:Na+/H+ antiporter NhaA [Nocardioides sp.]